MERYVRFQKESTSDPCVEMGDFVNYILLPTQVSTQNPPSPIQNLLTVHHDSTINVRTMDSTGFKIQLYQYFCACLGRWRTHDSKVGFSQKGLILKLYDFQSRFGKRTVLQSGYCKCTGTSTCTLLICFSQKGLILKII